MKYSRPMPKAPTSPPKAVRSRPEDRREAVTWEAMIGETKVFLTVSHFDDGSPCELFIDVTLADSTVRALCNQWAILASQALQYGLPLEDLLEKVLHTRFEPAGIVQGHPRIANCLSVLDYVGRALSVEYLQKEELAHKPAPDSL